LKGDGDERITLHKVKLTEVEPYLQKQRDRGIVVSYKVRRTGPAPSDSSVLTVHVDQIYVALYVAASRGFLTIAPVPPKQTAAAPPQQQHK
jgi:hypothetical protein